MIKTLDELWTEMSDMADRTSKVEQRAEIGVQDRLASSINGRHRRDKKVETDIMLSAIFTSIDIESSCCQHLDRHYDAYDRIVSDSRCVGPTAHASS